MKIGFSFGMCIRDIVQGTVDLQDVLVIISRTRCERFEQFDAVINDYMHDHTRFHGLDKDRVKEIVAQLWDTGRIFQPRVMGMGMTQVPARYTWMDVSPTVKDMDESTKDAWDAYRVTLALASDMPIPDKDQANVVNPHARHESQKIDFNDPVFNAFL